MKAARTLDGRGRAVLRELYLLRDRCAREANRPAFKVLSDLFLAEAARRLPKTDEELLRVPGASAHAVRRVAPEVLQAVKSGSSGEPLARPRAGRKRAALAQGSTLGAVSGVGGALRTAARLA